ncbi:MAG: isoprenylcysteine carboxylmethyltransferase family protein [Candidatus Lokiarchaeota archaeon]|nr:isoprenylcysteine carboxylmethyltransferase family protein [Candidatus Lokiarchaeota archaeon]
MKDIIKKILLFLILQIAYPTIFYILFIPEIFTVSIYVLYLLTNYVIALADALIRPLTKERNPSKIYDFLMLLMFLLSPFFLIAAFYENKLLISSILPFWDSFIVSYVGFVIYLSAGIFVIVGRVQLDKFGSGELITEEGHKLNTEGVYKYIRNPMYSGALIGVIGFGLVFRSIITLLIVSIFYFIVFKMRINEEERLLYEAFGEEFTDYKKKSKKLIPFIY